MHRHGRAQSISQVISISPAKNNNKRIASYTSHDCHMTYDMPTYTEVVIATGGIEATCCSIIVTVALHLQAAVTEDGGVVWPRWIGKIDGLGVWIKLTLYKWTTRHVFQ